MKLAACQMQGVLDHLNFDPSFTWLSSLDCFPTLAQWETVHSTTALSHGLLVLLQDQLGGSAGFLQNLAIGISSRLIMEIMNIR